MLADVQSTFDLQMFFLDFGLRQPLSTHGTIKNGSGMKKRSPEKTPVRGEEDSCCRRSVVVSLLFVVLLFSVPLRPFLGPWTQRRTGNRCRRNAAVASDFTRVDVKDLEDSRAIAVINHAPLVPEMRVTHRAARGRMPRRQWGDPARRQGRAWIFDGAWARGRRASAPRITYSE